MSPIPLIDKEVRPFSFPKVNEVILIFKQLSNLGAKVTTEGRLLRPLS